MASSFFARILADERRRDRYAAMSRFFWICLGGAVGTGARYLLTGWVLAALGVGFPWGTLAVNLIGSFAIGGVMHVGVATALLSPTLRMTLTTGVLGGFTTYSAFNYESLRLAQDGAWLLAGVNVLVMVVSCLAAGTAGIWIARLVLGR
jgi:fluoride exporter